MVIYLVHLVYLTEHESLLKFAPFGSLCGGYSFFWSYSLWIWLFNSWRSEIFVSCFCWQESGRAERGGSAIQIEVPAAVVSHVSKIGLNWSKWANLGGKETRGLNFRDFWALPSTNKSRRESHCKCARVSLNKFEHSTIWTSMMSNVLWVWVWHTANSRIIISGSAISGRC